MSVLECILQMFLDERLIWEGPIRRAPDAPKPGSAAAAAPPASFAQSIVFTADERLLARERPFVFDQGAAVEQEVTFYDHRRLVKQARELGQPMTDVVAPRPHTAVPMAKASARSQ